MEGLGLYAACVKGLLFGVALVVVLGGLDDLVVDAAYLIYRLQRRLSRSGGPPLAEGDLKPQPEQPIAVMVPAWQESNVIAGMLDNLLRSFDYANYAVFVGVYPNDAATEQAVGTVSRRDTRLHIVRCPHPGPTSKGDCLNAIYAAARRFGERAGVPFAAYVLHDSEDVVHPLELKLFNGLIPGHDMVQIPVLPLERSLWDLTGGHYIDEFAEGHVKELVVRQRLTGVLPSAGVGCAFSRRALEACATRNGGDPFNAESVTEDYDIGIRIASLGLKQAFVRAPIRSTVRRRSLLSGRERLKPDVGVIATREFFPNRIGAACRQKARWQLGITFQGWRSFAWRGTFGQRYAFWRDRKGHIAAHVGLLCWLALAATAVFHGAGYLRGLPSGSLIPQGSITWWLLLAATVFLINRSIQRAMAVRRHYGWAQAVLSVPRQLWGHVINFLAGARALGLFLRHLATGEPLGWEKTAHSFPSASELAPFRRRLGDLLVERQLVSSEALDAASERQARDGRPLGAILLDQGAVDEDALFDVLASQHAIRRVELDPLMVAPEILALVPRSVAIRYSVFPVCLAGDGTLVVASDRIVTSRRRNAIATDLKRPVEFRLATRSDLAAAIRWGYEKSADPLVNETEARSIKRLIDSVSWSAKDVKQARRRQRRAYRSLGSILVDQGVLRQGEIDAAVERAVRREGAMLGGFLIGQGLITEVELGRALERQAATRVSMLDVAPMMAAGE
jgi:bacteriophage N4 adsorption protein B